MPILDFHCHFSHEFFRFREYRMEPRQLLGEMDRHGVDRAVVSAAGEFAAYAVTEGNSEINQLVLAHPDRFIGFCTVNPWMRGRATDEINRTADLFARGVVLHPLLQGFEANDPLVFPVIEAAIRRKLVVYVTAGAPILAMPYKVADLAERYPEGRFVLGHAGWDFHFDVLYCLQACPNLWAESSKNELCNLEAIVRTTGVERLLFGSDYPFSSYSSELEKIRLLPGLAATDIDSILGRNGAALLGLEAS
jgi:predicted TIM-barrel fold metal-dependent hydrolase